MKAILPLAILFVCSSVTIAQTISSSDSLYKVYVQKQRENRTLGWVFVSAGVGLTIGGALKNFDQPFLRDRDESRGLGLTIVGLASTAAGIYCFTKASKNRKLAKLALKDQVLYFGPKPINQPRYTALAFSWRINNQIR